ncbi:hypothetical protein HD597_012332 [Nonomuraea thailandensis]|uniref:GerMN domain-containing protein n=1 Tax=Nonomuraea thailandensis TaxID=1188745 RepID=A0A9X2GX63_9ACTN|nr:hypothetical protein [Nonomuraea thailandensis]MCP2365312.1 hypothetical protein [Nonomuraea thailandensis]
MTNPAWRMISAPLIALFVLAGCGGTDNPEAPTAAEAGATLKEHITRTFEGAQAKDVQITDPGGKDVPCSEGKVKRTYAATARNDIGSGDPNSMLLVMAGALDLVAEYELNAPGQRTMQDLVSKEFRTHIVLSSPAKHVMVISGETDCLLPG